MPRLPRPARGWGKEFWSTAVLLLSKTDSFTLAHIRYLEWYAIKQATEAARYALDNGNAGSKPFITEPMEADVLDAFDTGGVLLATLGFPLFEPVAGKKFDAKQPTYFCNGPDTKGVGRLVADGFVVLKGSTARTESSAGAGKYVGAKRQNLLTSGVLVPDGSVLRFDEDYLFDSPSGAAQVVLGRNANGWDVWKTADGRTLHDVERAAVQPEASDVVEPTG